MFSGFLNRDRDKSAAKKPSEGVQVFSSNAAAAVAASVAAAPQLEASSETPGHKGRILDGGDIEIDLNELRPGEVVTELQVQPITLIKSELKLEHTQQVAISNSYICYGLKAGHIRTLNRNTATRALFKGHPTSLSYVAFFNPDTNLLASCSREGDIAVRMVKDATAPDGDIVPADTILLLGQLPVQQTENTRVPPVTLAWHPSIPQILAAGAAGTVSIFEVPTAAPEQQPPPLSQPGIKCSLPNDAAVTAVAFSPRGDLLLAGDSAGFVHAWWMEGEEDLSSPLLTWQPFHVSEAVASVHVLQQAADGSTLLLTGDADIATLKLWLLPAAGSAADLQPRCLQTVSFTFLKSSGQLYGDRATDIFCHVVVQPQLQLAVLANTARKQVYTLHYALGDPAGAAAGLATAKFDYLAQFSVRQPILSLTTGLEAVESQEVPGKVQPQQLLLYTVQTDAVQQYVIDPAMCVPLASVSRTGMQSASGEATEASSSGSTAAEPLAVDGSAVHDPATTAAGKTTAADTAGDSVAESVQESTAESEQTAAAAADDDDVNQPVAAVSSAPAATAVPPPAQLPSLGLLLHSRSETAASAAAQNAAVATAPQAAPAAGDSHLSRAAPADDVAEEQVEPAAPGEQATASRSSMAAIAQESAVATEHAAALNERPATPDAAPLPPMPTSTLIHSAEKAVPASSPPVTAPLGPADEADAPARAQPAVAADDLVAAAPAVRIAAADVTALQQQMQQMLAMQQELAAQLQLNAQQSVAGVKSELKSSLRSTESSLKQQFENSLKATAKRSEDIRGKAAAKERQELEKAIAAQLVQWSGNLQRDMLKAITDIVREQARIAVQGVVNTVTPQVTAAMQKELAGAAGNPGLQSVLERSLTHSLSRPLHEALRENFASSIIPAFERATQVMFGQVETAFSSWLAESNRTVSTAQSDATSALTAAVTQLNSAVSSVRGDLADTSKSLSRIASSAAARTTEPGSGGGAISVAQLEAGGGVRPAAHVDPRAEIGTLLGQGKYEEALVKALNTTSLDVLIWTCKQVDPATVLSGNSVGVSQTTLLSLVHQLAADLHNDANTALKMAWLQEAAPAVDPHDTVTAPHLKSVLTGVMKSLKQLVNSLPTTDATAKKGKITLHLFNSLLHQ